MKTKPNSQRNRKLPTTTQQIKQKPHKAEEPEFLTPEEEELYSLLEQDQQWLNQKIARLKALPGYQHLSTEQAEEMAVSMFRFAALIYEMVTSG